MSEPQLVVVDGREALAYVIVRPAPTAETPERVTVEAYAVDVSKRAMAGVLRQVADKFEAEDPEQGGPDAR